ncbi:MAG: 4Fe-4S dicluster domain-containing protein [Candidatus Omnitrophota bacterium]
MPRITINKDKCKGCLLCVSACPQGLIIIDDELNLRGIKPVKFSPQANAKAAGAPGKAGKKCLGCAMCAVICPDCCIEVYR